MKFLKITFFILLSCISIATQAMNKKKPRRFFAMPTLGTSPIDKDAIMADLTRQVEQITSPYRNLDQQVKECDEKTDELKARLNGFWTEFSTLNGLSKKIDFANRFIEFRNELQQNHLSLFVKAKDLERTMIYLTKKSINDRRKKEQSTKNIAHKNKSPLAFTPTQQ